MVETSTWEDVKILVISTSYVSTSQPEKVYFLQVYSMGPQQLTLWRDESLNTASLVEQNKGIFVA